ncbi:DUF6542 domain-containing protein [Streptomyces sp. NBC_01477]|uniref:DUF6542 domain-containing protein n=1 Tax=Streptomyces sp. NBC_01477 TaxID=2976015 RepID=UPI002E3722D7|nr:DUF6542 domain-containing protein [Streptomyces sp. NBC_01477]
MDQHSARPGGTGGAPPPAPGGEAAAGVYGAPPAVPAKPARPLAALVRRLRAVQRPRPRLTGLGTGLLTTVVTVLAGTVDALLFDGPGVFFGLAFVAVSATAAVYVRPYDLVAAPVSAPIAFAVGIGLTADGGDGGLVGHLLGLFTGLALMTGWLYAGTVLAALIVAVRALRLPSRRRRSRRCSAAPRERSRR